MSAKVLILLASLACIATLIKAGGHGGGHKKVVIHVPLYIKKHTHKHTIVKHIHHHKKGGGGGDDHYEVLGYTYGQPKPAPHFGGGHGWGAAEETHGDETPVSFEGDSGSYSLSGAGDEGSEGFEESQGY